MIAVMSMRAQKKQDSHKRIVQAAARALREKGFEGLGVAEVMHDAGLTHGGFYAHFASKTELLAEAVEQAGVQSAELLMALAQGNSGAAPRMSDLVDAYLSSLHLSTPGFGCPVAALGSDTVRQAEPVRQALTHRVQAMTSLFEQALTRTGASDALARRQQALAIVSTLVGAMTMARAVDSAPLADEILAAARHQLRDTVC